MFGDNTVLDNFSLPESTHGVNKLFRPSRSVQETTVPHSPKKGGRGGGGLVNIGPSRRGIGEPAPRFRHIGGGIQGGRRWQAKSNPDAHHLYSTSGAAI
jgi:hypothetical protein